jgi:hypothetical protein
LLLIFGFNANAVVADREDPGLILLLGAHMDKGLALCAAVFYGVTDQILEELLEMRGMDPYGRQLVARNIRAARREGGAEIGESLLEGLIGVNRILGSRKLRDLSINEKIADQKFHARRTGSQVLQEFPGLSVELFRMTASGSLLRGGAEADLK